MHVEESRLEAERIVSEKSVKEWRRRKTKPVSPSDPHLYAKGISVYSKLTAATSLFPGRHFEKLAAYLHQPYEVQGPKIQSKETSNVNRTGHEFAILCDLNPSSRNTFHLHSITEFEACATTLLNQSEHGQLLFMRGNPTPEWLLAIGAKYMVDPSLFYQHLGFHHGNVNYFESPSLPSAVSNIIRLRLTTIGDTMLEPRNGSIKQQTIEKLREHYEKLLRAYCEELQESHLNSALGNSIVRDVSIFDTRHFAIEQDVSIWAGKTEKSWIVIAWLDTGLNISEAPTSWLAHPPHVESQQWLTQLLPVIQHKPYAPFKPRSTKSSVDSQMASTCQSSSLLHLDYGRDLDRHALASDAFYASTEIFKLTAFSESQFLNMIHSKLSNELSPTSIIGNKDFTLSNLFYYQNILERHLQRTSEIRETIKLSSQLEWPKNDSEKTRQDVAEASSAALLQDYDDLLQRTRLLHTQCDRGVQIMMNNASILESQKAIIQAEQVTRLTRLAFIFIPLSFLTSFFGMNFKELGTGTLSVWVWFVPATPLVVISLYFTSLGLRSKILHSAQRRGQGRRRTLKTMEEGNM